MSLVSHALNHTTANRALCKDVGVMHMIAVWPATDADVGEEEKLRA